MNTEQIITKQIKKYVNEFYQNLTTRILKTSDELDNHRQILLQCEWSIDPVLNKIIRPQSFGCKNIFNREKSQNRNHNMGSNDTSGLGTTTVFTI